MIKAEWLMATPFGLPEVPVQEIIIKTDFIYKFYLKFILMSIHSMLIYIIERPYSK